MRTIAILLFGLAAACTSVKDAPPGATPQPEPAAVAPPAAAPPPAPVVAPPPAAPLQPASKGEPIATEAVVGAAPPQSENQGAKPASPPVKAPAKAPAPAVAAEPPPKSEKPAAAVAKPQEPPLDVAALTARLRDTKAIGTFTKLALKNQVDDLLKQFRALYASGRKGSVDSLRQPYNMLILKVLSLLQDSDPALARTISASREAIWRILADPEKFNSLT